MVCTMKKIQEFYHRYSFQSSGAGVMASATFLRLVVAAVVVVRVAVDVGVGGRVTLVVVY